MANSHPSSHILPLVLSLFLYHPLLSDIQTKRGSGSVYNVSYEQGLKEIHNLARTSMLEDEYLFTDKWHDVGIDESEQSVENDDKEIRNIMKGKNFRKASMIHIHPNKKRLISPPSFEDLEAYVKDEKLFSEFGCELTSQVADQNGIWTVVLSEKTKRAISKGSIHPDYVRIERDCNDAKYITNMYSGKKEDAVKLAIEMYKKIGVDLLLAK